MAMTVSNTVFVGSGIEKSMTERPTNEIPAHERATPPEIAEATV